MTRDEVRNVLRHYNDIINAIQDIKANIEAERQRQCDGSVKAQVITDMPTGHTPGNVVLSQTVLSCDNVIIKRYQARLKTFDWLKRRVHRAEKHLNDIQRQIIKSHYHDSKTIADIADDMGYSDDIVREIITKAIKIMAKYM